VIVVFETLLAPDVIATVNASYCSALNKSLPGLNEDVTVVCT
jgi:hypothetical protein